MGHTSNSKGYQEMKYMLQLQDYNVTKFKGLYIDIEHIESVVPLVLSDNRMTNGIPDKEGSKYRVVGSTIRTKSGKEWNVHNDLAEVLAKLDDYNEYMKGQAK